jgi:predicted permease
MSTASDVRYAIRLLLRSPVFTMTSVLSLAAGVAATTAIFALADALLLRPRPGVADPATLVDVGRSTGGDGGLDNFGYPLFETLRDRTTTVASLAATQWTPTVMALGDATSSERVFATLVSFNYFEVVGVRPALGRFFVADEDRAPGMHPVVVLSHQFWSRHFQADREIVGRTIRLNNLPYTVVGITEPGFGGTTFIGTDFWVPMAMDAHVRAADTSLLQADDSVWMTAIGRLKTGVTVPQARDELGAIMTAYWRDRGDDRATRWRMEVRPSTRVPGGIAGPVIGFVGMLGALTGIVLLIACSNIAAMLLARGLERRREVATRVAIGASRRHILAQLLVEGLTLALTAGVLSVPLATALIGVLSSLQPSLPIPIALDLEADPRVMLFALALAGTTAMLFALAPALHATRFELAPALHGQHATADRRRAWMRHGLVTAQIAMALLLLVSAGLFMRSLQQAAEASVGLDVRGVDTLQIDTRVGGYRTDAEGMRVVQSLLERFRALPRIESVSASRMVPLQGGGLGLGGLHAPGYVGPDGSDAVNSDWDVVTPGYFETLHVQVARGRTFDEHDTANSPPVAIVNEQMAQQLWPGQDAIGRKLVQRISRTEQRTLEVVGVARTVKYRSLGEAPRNFIYVPVAQQYLSDLTFYVRHSGDSQLAELRRAVASFDPNLPIIHTDTLEKATAIGLLPQRLAAWIAGAVGTIGLCLAALGLYGMTSFAVAQRTREIAMRMALGATRQRILAMVLRQSSRPALLGLAVGLTLAMGVGQLVRSLLVGIGSIDPLAFGVATALLLAVLVVAAWAPARRASVMDPMRALRAE